MSARQTSRPMMEIYVDGNLEEIAELNRLSSPTPHKVYSHDLFCPKMIYCVLNAIYSNYFKKDTYYGIAGNDRCRQFLQYFIL